MYRAVCIPPASHQELDALKDLRLVGINVLLVEKSEKHVTIGAEAWISLRRISLEMRLELKSFHQCFGRDIRTEHVECKEPFSCVISIAVNGACYV